MRSGACWWCGGGFCCSWYLCSVTIHCAMFCAVCTPMHFKKSKKARRKQKSENREGQEEREMANENFHHRVHKEWQWPLSGVYSIMMEKSAQSSEGWGKHAYPFSLYLPSLTKLWCTLQLRGQTHSPYFYSTPKCTL